MKKFLLGAFAVLGLSVFGLAYTPEASALSNTLTGVTAEQISVTTTAELLTNDMESGKGKTFRSCMVFNNSATVLYVGGEDVDATDGMPVCTDSSCVASSLTVDGRDAWVVAASGTLTPTILCGR